MIPYYAIPLITGLVLVPFATGCGIKQTAGMAIQLAFILGGLAALVELARILTHSIP